MLSQSPGGNPEKHRTEPKLAPEEGNVVQFGLNLPCRQEVIKMHEEGMCHRGLDGVGSVRGRGMA